MKFFANHPKWTAAFLALFAGMLVWLSTIFSHSFEPSYEGRKLSDWSADLLGPESSFNMTPPPEALAKQDKAVMAIRHFGIQSLPLALKLCGTEDSPFVEKMKDWLGEQEWFHLPIPSDYDYQKRGLKIFETLGPAAKPAIPALLKLLQRKRDYTLATAGSALFYIGPDAIPPLIDELTNQNPKARTAAAITLGAFGKKAKAAEPDLLRCVRGDSFYYARCYAAIALTQVGVDATNAVPALMAALGKESGRSLSGVYYALGYYGTNAEPAVPKLVQLWEAISNQPPDLCNKQILQTIQKIDPKTAQLFIERPSASPSRGPVLTPRQSADSRPGHS